MQVGIILSNCVLTCQRRTSLTVPRLHTCIMISMVKKPLEIPRKRLFIRLLLLSSEQLSIIGNPWCGLQLVDGNVTIIEDFAFGCCSS